MIHFGVFSQINLLFIAESFFLKTFLRIFYKIFNIIFICSKAYIFLSETLNMKHGDPDTARFDSSCKIFNRFISSKAYVNAHNILLMSGIPS